MGYPVLVLLDFGLMTLPFQNTHFYYLASRITLDHLFWQRVISESMLSLDPIYTRLSVCEHGMR